MTASVPGSVMLPFSWLSFALAAPHPALKNIFIMFGDDVGYGDIGAFGHPTSKTPHLDAFASSGVKLLQYLMSSVLPRYALLRVAA